MILIKPKNKTQKNKKYWWIPWKTTLSCNQTGREGHVNLACPGGTESARLLDVGHAGALFRFYTHTFFCHVFVRAKGVFLSIKEATVELAPKTQTFIASIITHKFCLLKGTSLSTRDCKSRRFVITNDMPRLPYVKKTRTCTFETLSRCLPSQ